MDPSGAAWDEATVDPVRDIDWPWVLERARAHKLIGLISKRTQDSGFEGQLPGPVQAQLAEERKRGDEHLQRVGRTLSWLQELLEALECPFMVVKGSVYAHDLYDAPTTRRFSDIDIVIPHGKLAQVDGALTGAGYFFWTDPKIHRGLPRWFKKQAPDGEVPGSREAAKRILAAFHRHHLYVLKKDDPRMHVEVHWNVFVPGEGGAREQDLWSETRRTVVEGVEAQTLGWEASLLHAAVHAVEQPPAEVRLLHLADLAWMADRWAGRMDFRKLRALAGSWGLEGYLRSAGAALAELLPRGIPAGSPPLLRKPGMVRSALLAGAGFGPWIVDKPLPEGRIRELAQNVRREAFWEMALGRPPAAAWGRVSRALRARLPVGSGASSSPTSNPG